MDLAVTLSQLQLFCRVVELGNETRVAEERHVAQPAVNGQIALLQRRLGGAKLLYWDGRRMRLTASGEAAYAWAQTLIEETESLERTLDGIRSGSSGSVAVGASLALGNYLVPKVLLSVREQVPNLRVVLRVFGPVTTVADLEEGRLDLAIVVLDTPPRSARVTWHNVGTDSFVLVSAPGRYAACPDTASTIGTLPFVCAATGQTTRRLIDTRLAAADLSLRRVVMECGTPETIMSAVRAGVGVAFQSRYVVADDLAAGRLTELSTPGLRMDLPVLIGQHAHRALSPV
ncbi:MAG: LysR family transcriptional regulator, partial [Trebonia sp.]